jgi:putative NADPH-quinone reductase
MSNILIINAGKTFAHSKGALNISLTEVADSFLRDAGHRVRVTKSRAICGPTLSSIRCQVGGWARRGR